MSRASIIAARDAFVAEFGPWTAHDIALGDGVSTLDQGCWHQWRVDRIADLLRRDGCDLEHSRILDLACLEGLFAIEFARMGAETVGLEIRDVHLRKAEFARATLALENCRFVQGDVRAIPADLGDFDVILCAGILYHLDFPDCVKFLRHMAERSRRSILIDSHFAYRHISSSVLPLGEMAEWEFDNRIYWGRMMTEHAPHLTAEQKRTEHTWASIDNDRSVWLTEGSVIAELKRCEFFLADQAVDRIRHRPSLTFLRRARPSF